MPDEDMRWWVGLGKKLEVDIENLDGNYPHK